MNNRFLKISLSGLAAVAAFSFIACGDDVSEVTRIQQPAVFNAVADSLPACDAATSGELYVSSEKLLLCDGEKWSGLNGVSAENGADGVFCTTTAVKDGLKILCDGDSVGIIKNGVAGAAGNKGPAGENGSYCVAEENAFGYDIYCDGELTGTISNGAPGSSGSKGKEGDDGTYCVTSATSTGFDVVCNGEKIGEITNGAPGSSGSKGGEGDDGTYCVTSATSMGFDVVCNGEKVGEISNGAPGSSGSKGREGDDGTYCVTVATATGFDLVCNGEKVGEIDNGAPGSSGSKGDVATGCTFTKNENGSYTQKCGDRESVVYAAVCGTESYNPLGDKFCYGITLYDRCGGKDYNPAKQFCLDGALTELCGGKDHTAEDFCLNNEVTAKCDGKTFEENEFCQGSTIKKKCGGKDYTVDQFCDGSTVVDKCDGSVYSPATESCTSDGVRPKCGTMTYNPETQFCLERTPTELCGGKEYTAEQFCLNGSPTVLCGGKTYTTSQFCLNNVVTSKCGGKTYTSSQFCSESTVYDKCGSSTYTPSSQFCDSRDNHIYKYVKIGTQTWMAEDLKFESTSLMSNLTGNIFCYANNVTNCQTYGRLYTWTAALNISSAYKSKSVSVANKQQGACPLGWHLPNDSEWSILSSYVDSKNGSEGVGTSLKASTKWTSKSGIPTGTNRFGFTAYPSGNHFVDNTFNDLGRYVDYWSATQVSATQARYWYIDYDKTILGKSSEYTKGVARPVRCVKD